MPFVGVTVKPTPLHVVAVLLAIRGFGLTVTITVNVEPTQLPAAPLVGVTVYVIVCAKLVKLVSVCPILDCADDCALCPVIFVFVEIVQVYVVLAGTISLPLLFGVIVNASPLQIVAVLLAIAGFGLMVATTVNVGPLHNPLVGVTV